MHARSRSPVGRQCRTSDMEEGFWQRGMELAAAEGLGEFFFFLSFSSSSLSLWQGKRLRNKPAFLVRLVLGCETLRHHALT